MELSLVNLLSRAPASAGAGGEESPLEGNPFGTMLVHASEAIEEPVAVNTAAAVAPVGASLAAPTALVPNILLAAPVVTVPQVAAPAVAGEAVTVSENGEVLPGREAMIDLLLGNTRKREVVVKAASEDEEALEPKTLSETEKTVQMIAAAAPEAPEEVQENIEQLPELAELPEEAVASSEQEMLLALFEPQTLAGAAPVVAESFDAAMLTAKVEVSAKSKQEELDPKRIANTAVAGLAIPQAVQTIQTAPNSPQMLAANDLSVEAAQAMVDEMRSATPALGLAAAPKPSRTEVGNRGPQERVDVPRPDTARSDDANGAERRAEIAQSRPAHAGNADENFFSYLRQNQSQSAGAEVAAAKQEINAAAERSIANHASPADVKAAAQNHQANAAQQEATFAKLVRTTHQPHAGEQVSVKIQQAVKGGMDRVSIQLDPADLGRVDVRMDISSEGRAQVIVTADNRDTLDLLQRDARSLQKALEQVGLDMEGGSMEFNMRHEQAQQQGGDQNQGKFAGGQAYRFGVLGADDKPLPDAVDRMIGQWQMNDEALGLDIKV